MTCREGVNQVKTPIWIAKSELCKALVCSVAYEIDLVPLVANNAQKSGEFCTIQ